MRRLLCLLGRHETEHTWWPRCRHCNRYAPRARYIRRREWGEL